MILHYALNHGDSYGAGPELIAAFIAEIFYIYYLQVHIYLDVIIIMYPSSLCRRKKKNIKISLCSSTLERLDSCPIDMGSNPIINIYTCSNVYYLIKN